MTNKKLKTLAAVIACTMALGAAPSVPGTSGLPAVTTTVEAAAKNVTLKVSGKKVKVGKKVKLNAKATKGAKLSYKSSNKKIATVSRRGVITGKKAGKVKITITAKKEKYKTTKKTVTVKVSRQDQVITAPDVTLTAGQNLNLGAKARTALAYKSSNTKVVSVDQNGNLTAKRPGTAKITLSAKTSVTFNKASRTVTVKVVKKTTQPVTTPKPAPQPVPQPVQPVQPVPQPSPTPTETPQPDVSYVTDVRFDETAHKTDTIYIGEPKASTLKWTATGNTTFRDFVYTSSDPSIATVDENGTITGIAPGEVRITARSKTPFAAVAGGSENDYFAASWLYRIEAKHNADYIGGVGFKNPENVDEKGRNVAIGETINPNAGISDYSLENCEKYLTFTSSDPSIATIDAHGNITGVSKGYVTMTVRTKLPVDAAGKIYQEDSATYHVGDYTYEEILEGLTMDTVAGQAAHEVMNDLRQNPDHRSFFKDYPSYPTREWDEGILRNAVTRASRNIVCEILGGWVEGEKSSVNPLASHGGAFNGYGGSGWESTGSDLGHAASVFFEDAGHFGNETDPYFKYEAVAVVQYKNAAGINLTSMIVDASGESYNSIVADYQKRGESYIDQCIKVSQIPENQYYDFCKHFGLPTTDTISANAVENTEDAFSDGAEPRLAPVETAGETSGLDEQGTKPADVEEVETAEESVETDDPEEVTEVLTEE